MPSPSLENLAKEADGQQKMQQINRYAGGGIALIMSIGYYFVIRNMGALKYVSGAAGVFAAVVIIATFVAGAQLITWCGEQIDDKGIGNGVSPVDLRLHRFQLVLAVHLCDGSDDPRQRPASPGSLSCPCCWFWHWW